VGCLSTHAYFLLGLVAKENALLWIHCRVNSRDTAVVASGRVDSKGTIDVTTSLIKFNCLPGVLGRLTYARVGTFDYSWALDLLCVGALNALNWDVSLYLIFSEPKRKIQLKGPVVVLLARLRLLKAHLIRVCCCTRATLCRASGILRAVVIRRTICSRSCRGREE